MVGTVFCSMDRFARHGNLFSSGLSLEGQNVRARVENRCLWPNYAACFPLRFRPRPFDNGPRAAKGFTRKWKWQIIPLAGSRHDTTRFFCRSMRRGDCVSRLKTLFPTARNTLIPPLLLHLTVLGQLLTVICSRVSMKREDTFAEND